MHPQMPQTFSKIISVGAFLFTFGDLIFVYFFCLYLCPSAYWCVCVCFYLSSPLLNLFLHFPFPSLSLIRLSAAYFSFSVAVPYFFVLLICFVPFFVRLIVVWGEASSKQLTTSDKRQITTGERQDTGRCSISLRLRVGSFTYSKCGSTPLPLFKTYIGSPMSMVYSAIGFDIEYPTSCFVDL